MAPYKQPCDDAIRMDKEIALIMERQANDRDDLLEVKMRVDKIEDKQGSLELKNAKSTALWSAIGSAVSVLLMLVTKWLITKG